MSDTCSLHLINWEIIASALVLRSLFSNVAHRKALLLAPHSVRWVIRRAAIALPSRDPLHCFYLQLRGIKLICKVSTKWELEHERVYVCLWFFAAHEMLSGRARERETCSCGTLWFVLSLKMIKGAYLRAYVCDTHLTFLVRPALKGIKDVSSAWYFLLMSCDNGKINKNICNELWELPVGVWTTI